jgi:anti-sigma factor RsiW
MGDVESHLSAEELADLAALADGSLRGERRAEVEARVAASPELARMVDRQRRSVDAVRSTADEAVPASLRSRVEELRPGASGSGESRRLLPRLALGTATGVVVAVVAAVLVLSGGGSAPTVADAAQLATKPATAPPPEPAAGNANALRARVEGVAFPNLARPYGWTPTGLRRGTVDGRDALVVFYAKRGRRLAYMVVAGESLGGTSDYASSRLRGVEYRSFNLNGGPAVTWLRDGHTCVLTGDASRTELLALASGPAPGAPY